MIEQSLHSILEESVLIDGRYRPCRLLGKGGMGWVIEAEDTYLDGQRIVLKFLYPHLVMNEKVLLGFRSEVLVARKIIHHSVVRTYNFAMDVKFGHYIVMEFVIGQTLRQFMGQSKEGRIPLEQVLGILQSLLQGIHYAHSYGVIHLDIKPENVFLNEKMEAKLGDFGIAQSFRKNQESSRRMLGTPLYMAPEQFRGQLLGKETDIYSLGVLLYEMLAGETPFQATTIYNIAQMHQNEIPAELTEIRDDVPDWLCSVVRRCLEKKPEDRFRSAEDILQIFAQFTRAGDPQALDFGPSVMNISAETSVSQPRNLIWQNKLFLALTLVLFSYFIVRSGRGRSWLHQSLLVATLASEKTLGIELTSFRRIFELKARMDSSFFDVSLEPGAIASLVLLGAPPDQYERDTGKSYLVKMAALPHEPIEFEAVLEAGGDPNAFDRGSLRTSLHVLRGPDSARRATLLIEKGADVNRRDYLGMTPLLTAVKGHELDLVRVLLANGADPLIADYDGITPLFVAKSFTDTRFLRLLEDRPRRR